MASDPKPGSPRPFDVKTVEYLIELMAEHDLTEVSLQEGEQKIRLRKGHPAPVFSTPPPNPYPTPYPAPPGGNSNPAAIPAPPPSPAAPARQLHEIKSEMVGSFYTRPAPGKDEYVKVGSKVRPDTVVCVIVAMKINNEIHAGVAGTIAEVCLKNEDPVDFGTVLFRVDTSA